jgi:large subunit ribosomal protein L28
MPRRCQLTGKSVRFGRNVSHSNRKSSRRFEPNLQSVSLRSEALKSSVRLSLSTRTLRTVEKVGGLDIFLRRTPDDRLPPEALRLKRRICTALG